MKTINDIDDPRLTAWALGELEGAEAEAVAAFVSESEEARAAVEEIRELSGLLVNELASEASAEELSLDPGRRDALSQALELGAPTERRPAILIRMRPFMAVAAVLLVTVFVADTLIDGGSTESSGMAMFETSRSEHPRASTLGNGNLVLERREAERLTEAGEGDTVFWSRMQSLGYTGGRSGGSAGQLPSAEQSVLVSDQALAFGTASIPVERRDAGDVAEFEAASRSAALKQLGYLGANADAAEQAVGMAFEIGREFDADASIDPSSSVADVSAVRAGRAKEAALPQLIVVPARDPNTPSSRVGRPGISAVVVPNETPVNTQQLDQLRALGYLGDNDGRDGLITERGRKSREYLERQAMGERYAAINENAFVPITSDPLSALSTFGVDVDTAAYANMRRFLHRNQLPPTDAVRIEELINYFTYDEPVPEGDVPFATHVEVSSCPWQPRHRLLRVALTGERLSDEERSPSHLVFLLDVSGSMKNADKLPLLIKSLELLLDDVHPGDMISIVTYASGTKVVLQPTSCEQRQTILDALYGLRADGSTHASAGIQLAYDVATQGFIEGGNNRIILATDGDFNVGVTSDGGLYDLIRAKAASGVFLTVLGFGTGNLKDATAELLADNGNGNYAYIDSMTEAYKVLVAERDATLVTIAKDVKLQLEFNPGKVAAYRLIGYENRKLAATDFRDDKKDAGEIGAGHSVVALYEIVPRGVEGVTGTVELKYQQQPDPVTFVDSPELLTVNLRWKRPDEDFGRELAVPVLDAGLSFAESREEFRFSAAVAAFGMLLRGSPHAGNADLKWVVETASAARSFDPNGDRSEFVRLVRTAQGLMNR
jgi:Ca-activated chloride channel family protein